MLEHFKYDGRDGAVTIYAYDVAGQRVDLFYLSTTEEALEVTQKLNQAVADLLQ